MGENIVLEKSYKFALRVVKLKRVQLDELRQSGTVQSADQNRQNSEGPSV